MQIQMLKLAAISAYNTITNKLYNNEESSQILEPVSTILRLATLNYRPTGTKISIWKNTINFQEPTIIQGISRWTNGDNRNDLHNIHNPISQFVKNDYYKLFGTEENYVFILETAISGLNKLKVSYHNSSIILHSLDRYISLLKKSKDNAHQLFTNNQNNDKLKDEDEDEDTNLPNSLYIEFTKLWNTRQVEIIINLLLEINELTIVRHSMEHSAYNICFQKNEIVNYIYSIDNMLNAKDKQVFHIVKNILSGS